MSKVFKTLFDPIGIFHDGGIIGAIKDKKDDSPTTPPASPKDPSDLGRLSDEEAAKIARQKLYRSGTVMTTPLGEAISQDQIAGARLR